MNKKIAVESLAMDLKRVALGLHRGSFKMAARFSEEALKRVDEVGFTSDLYLNKLLTSIRRVLKEVNEKTAEDALMYSVLIQNYALHKLE